MIPLLIPSRFFRTSPLVLAGAFLATLTTLARAEVALPGIFTDHMVLQRDQPVAVWGTATPGESVTVRFATESQSTVADSSGKWSLRLGALPASAEGREFTVIASNTITLTDVLVGEVWLCSGQSNMEKPLGIRAGQTPCDNSIAEIAAAAHPLLRLYQFPRNGNASEGDSTLRWLACSPASVDKSHFSASGYYFGRELLRELKVPVGLIHSSVGGTRIEPWTPPEAYSNRPALADIASAVAADQPYKKVKVGSLYASMIRPLSPYTLRGFIWYQGESNLMLDDSLVYTEKMRALIEGWRAAWGLPEAAFYHVQLAPYAYSRRKLPDHLSVYALPRFWEAQDRSLAIPHTGQAVINDTVTRSSDIHPTNKLDVGLRLARAALRQTYGRSDIVASGPIFASLEKRDSAIALRFDASEGLAARGGGALAGFAIAGENHQFVPAVAELSGRDVLVSSPSVAAPVAVRYAWHETAAGNLANASGLPARAFRTDDWPVETTRALAPEELAAPPAPKTP
ncbi:hypothetical protein IMCC26134_07710 [Verrucomicrobia bacterium IMCC26134]|nr:hypothetical protein IMCC26134_07710 [Verrucomicrobia bacterium IMCC26134]